MPAATSRPSESSASFDAFWRCAAMCLASEAFSAARSASDIFSYERLFATIQVHAITASKGLEFDNVVVLEPADLVDGSPRGLSDLYVALTRATQRVVVVHEKDLPEDLRDMARIGKQETL